MTQTNEESQFEHLLSDREKDLLILAMARRPGGATEAETREAYCWAKTTKFGQVLLDLFLAGRILISGWRNGEPTWAPATQNAPNAGTSQT